MLALRSSLFLTGQLLSTAVIAPLVLITMKSTLVKRYYFINWWVDFNLWWLKVTCNIDYKITGEEHIPGGGCVVIANHQSAWETILLNRLFPQCAYVLKKELFNLPFFGWALARLDQIPIDRKAGIRALDGVVRLGTAAIEANRKVIIFPEGTRTPPDDRRPYHAGAAVLATRCGADVLPIAHNAGRYWPRLGFLKRPGTIHVHVGPAISTAGLKPRELNRQVQHWIQDRQDLIDQLDPTSTPSSD